jgi:hypothetical protein
MGTYDDLFHQLRCSMHPLLRHYSAEALNNPANYGHALDYWNVPVTFRRECEKSLESTGITGYFAWKNKCLFSFDSTSPASPHAALLRNIFVPKEYRGQRVCMEALAQIVSAAEAAGTCILAVVHPFDIYGENVGLKAALEALHRTGKGFLHVDDAEPQHAMNKRLRKAGFRNCDLRDSMSEHGGKTIPLTNQWIFVPRSVDTLFLASITDRFVSESVYANESTGIAI